jgi:hypothetical protein
VDTITQQVDLNLKTVGTVGGEMVVMELYHTNMLQHFLEVVISDTNN